MDSLKSRLQTTKTPISVPRIALLVYREEGIIGFYRGLWIPLITISFVRTCSIHISVECSGRIAPGRAMSGAASFTIYTRTKEFFRDHHLIDHSKLLGCATVGGIGGAMAGSLISFGSARVFLTGFFLLIFSLWVRRQLSNSSRCVDTDDTVCIKMLTNTGPVLSSSGRFGGSWNTRSRRRRGSS